MITKKTLPEQTPVPIKIDTVNELVSILDKYSREAELEDSRRTQRIFSDN